MSRKHFIVIAKIIQDSQSRKELILDLATYLASQNKTISRSRFLETCGCKNL